VKLSKLCDLELRYTSLQSVDYESGGQLYRTMEGTAVGERLAGSLHLTNLAVRRPDNVNLPTLRGLLTTADGATVWLELDGIATLRSSDNARVFVTSCRFRSGDAAYRWLDTLVVVVEGVLDRVAVGGVARAALYVCQPTLPSAV
jgi:hypothetical protein